MRRTNGITPNTIGKRRCEVVLNEILIEQNDAYLTKRVMSRYNRFRDGCFPLVRIKDQRWRKTFLIMWYKKTLADLQKDRMLFTCRAYSFLRNCIVAHYRTMVRGYEK